MDYLISFDDGSSGYLSHHGVMGMKWGQRSAETQLKYQSGNGGQVKPGSGGGKQSGRRDSTNSGMIKAARYGAFGLAGMAYAHHADKKSGALDARKKEKAAKKAKKQAVKAASKGAWKNESGAMKAARYGAFGVAGMADANKKHKEHMANGSLKVQKHAATKSKSVKEATKAKGAAKVQKVTSKSSGSKANVSTSRAANMARMGGFGLAGMAVQARRDRKAGDTSASVGKSIKRTANLLNPVNTVKAGTRALRKKKN
jgi:hypothetical protein